MFLYLARVIIWLPENPTAHEGLIHVYGYIFKHAGNCASVFQLFQMLVSKSQLAHSEDMKLSCAESKHSSELLLSIQPWWEKFSCDEKCRSASSSDAEMMIPAENSSVKEVKNIQANEFIWETWLIQWPDVNALWCIIQRTVLMELQAEPWGHVGYISPSLVCRAVWCGGACTKRQGWLHQLWYPVRTHTYCGYAFIPSKSTLSLRELSFLTGKWGSAGDGSGCHTSPYVQMCQWLSNQVLIPHIGPFK